MECLSDVGKLTQMMESPVVAVMVEMKGTDPFIHPMQIISLATPCCGSVTIQLPLCEMSERACLQSLLGKESIKVLFDAKNSMKFLKRAGLELNGRIFDIRIADQLLKAGLSKHQRTIGELAHEYNIEGVEGPQLLLNLRDCLKEGLAKAKLTHTAITEFAAIRAVVEMEMNGMLLHRIYWEKAKALDSSGTDYVRHIHQITGRIHATYSQIGTDTGRFSCSNPNIHGIKKSLRHCFVAPPGYKLIDGDYSQQEVRILAEITRDEHLIAEFHEGLDIYIAIAAKIFNIQRENISVNQRQTAKTTVLGLMYGIGTKSLWDNLNAHGVMVTQADVERLKAAFFRQYPQVKDWYDIQRVSKMKEIRSLGGRRRLWQAYAPFTELCNSPIQATGADMLKTVLAMLPDALADTGIKIIACVHDQIILEAPTSKAETAKILLKNIMEQAGQTYIKHLPIKVDVQIRDAWK